jgi:hypothetical protein
MEARNKKRESPKQILIGQRERRINGRVDRGHWRWQVATPTAIQ